MRVLARWGGRVRNDCHFEHPAWVFGIVSYIEICIGFRSSSEFFRNLLETSQAGLSGLCRSLLQPPRYRTTQSAFSNHATCPRFGSQENVSVYRPCEMKRIGPARTIHNGS